VPALEEADAYAELKQRLGTPEAIASRVGKEVSYVARRLQLVSLAEMPRRALAERLIAVDHALLLARLGADEQDVNLKWCLDRNAGVKQAVEETIKSRIAQRDRKDRYTPWEPESVVGLKHHIEQHVGRKLSRAPWSLDDAKLVPDVGACDGCASNTKANTNLFGDLNIAAATCEDGGCFEAKRAAFVQIALSEATVKQDAGRGPAVRLSWKATTVKPRFSEAKAGAVMVDESGVNLLQTFKRGQWLEAKPKSCEHVRLGVTVDWSDDANRGYMGSGEKLRKPGQTLSVCIAPGCKAHRKEWEKPKAASGNSARDEKAEQGRRERENEERIAENKVRAEIAARALAGVKKLPADALRTLALGVLPSHPDGVKPYEALLPGIRKIIKTSKVESVEFARAVALASIEPAALTVRGGWGVREMRGGFVEAMKRIGYDASKAWDKPKAAAKADAKTAAKPDAKAAKKAPAKKAAKKSGRR
jgi:hypothetical protein